MSFNTSLFTLKTLSNLHVGSGEINFDIIDNQVQRDFDGLPNINSSSLKGALREHFTGIEETKNLVSYIFGPDNSSNDNHQTGAVSFFEAKLLSRPVRSNKRAYYSVTSPKVLNDFLAQIEAFKINIDENIKKDLKQLADLNPQRGKPLVFDAQVDCYLEDEKATASQFDTKNLTSLLGTNIALMHENDLIDLPLAINARNYLVNGESKNLWYEEVVPKESRFYFITLSSSNISPSDKDKIDGFSRRFVELASTVQIGANKSIGYGFCELKKVSK